MALENYRKKRKFEDTPEPRGEARRARKKTIFVVQKHDASHLHYDFRLEMEGVLVSWAVPKGPTMNPGNKRFATMTEDHPMEYADFEGVIPQGHYGGGTVMVWDRGTYEAEGDASPRAQLEKGKLKIELHGKKLRGAFVLVLMGQQTGKPREKSRWLLMKRNDQWGDPKWSADAPATARSAISGRTLEEIERGQARKKKIA